MWETTILNFGGAYEKKHKSTRVKPLARVRYELDCSYGVLNSL